MNQRFLFYQKTLFIHSSVNNVVKSPVKKMDKTDRERHQSSFEFDGGSKSGLTSSSEMFMSCSIVGV